MAIKDLETLLKKNKTLNDTWYESQRHCKGHVVPLGLRKEHITAICVYTYNGTWYKTLNDGIKEFGNINEYNSQFKLIGYHYLLTVALQSLGKSSKQLHVYRGTETPWFGKQGQRMRFGLFASTSLNRSVAERFGKMTLFELNTTYGVAIQEYSVNPSQKEVLIPPYERFEIVTVKGADPVCTFVLRSRGYQGVEVWLELDSSGRLRVYRKTIPWWAWLLIAVAIVVVLFGAGAGLYFLYRTYFD
ncbi:erythroblast NAD(P)(+)--arginine ADP-ribosyltransferase-like [Scyliorhinus canicula]|uniref:erythroblast NAD(P)(+)--arginine ADP-ribosyltransferase-like n=1 Tax=Scyliorhinus canicula TaxID=7830 RepID=UPI0018F33CCE|nr:erythroblast NAD(P)(+)--arginine ADP-ribosyltransferase-like [Scyliorhinus canicula]